MLRVLRGLETRGLVTRAPAPATSAMCRSRSRPTALALLAQAQKPAEKAYKRLLAPLDKAQQAQLVELLQLLTGELEDDARAAFVPPGQQVAAHARYLRYWASRCPSAPAPRRR